MGYPGFVAQGCSDASLRRLAPVPKMALSQQPTQQHEVRACKVDIRISAIGHADCKNNAAEGRLTFTASSLLVAGWAAEMQHTLLLKAASTCRMQGVPCLDRALIGC
jgi:hypothetical protein